MCIAVPNFTLIDQTVAEIWPFFNFSKWGPSAILDLFYAILDHPRTAFGVFATMQNLVRIGAVVSIICRFNILHVWLENAYSHPWGLWGIWNGKRYQQKNPKGTSLHGKTSYDVQIMKIGPLVRPMHVTETNKRKNGRETLQWQSGYLPRPPTSSDQNRILHGR